MIPSSEGKQEARRANHTCPRPRLGKRIILQMAVFLEFFLFLEFFVFCFFFFFHYMKKKMFHRGLDTLFHPTFLKYLLGVHIMFKIHWKLKMGLLFKNREGTWESKQLHDFFFNVGHPEAVLRENCPSLRVMRPSCHSCYFARNWQRELGLTIPSLELNFLICKMKLLGSLEALWGPFISNVLLFLSIGLRGNAGALTKKKENPKIQKYF